MGSFLFRWPHPNANDVHVTGTFDDWGKSVSLNKVGDVWEKDVELPKADKKILYKFVVNDEWIIDPEAPQEDDGQGNVNNVLHPDQIKPLAAVVPEAVTTSSAAPGSTTAAMAGQVPLEPKKEATEVTPASANTLTKEATESSLPGTFPETPMNEPESVSVNPLPATSGAGNPIDLPAGDAVPAPGDITSNSVNSTVTTSKEDYEKAGTSGIPIIGGALAALGLGGAAVAATGNKKENVIPESSLPMGKEAGETLDAGPTISSAGPTSTTADLAGKVPLEEKKAATVIDPQSTTSTVPEVVKESIAEAHTDPEATTSAEAVKEKTEVEQELLKKVPESDEAGAPAPTIAAATSGTAPSATESAADPTLADEPAVQMMNKNEAEATGASATAAESATAKTEETPAATATAPAPTTTDSETKKEEAKKETPAAKETTAATPASGPSTPAKKTDTTPTGTPSSAATKDKKKHRISSFFKKIFD